MKPLREAAGYAEDLQAAYDYYKGYSVAAAGRFLAAYEAEVAILSAHPFICRERRHGWRQMPIRQHPGFSIFYKELPACWLLGGIISTLRDPDLIQVRLVIREARET